MTKKTSMKKLFNIILLTFLVVSCKKEDTTPVSNTCNCYEQHEQQGAGGYWSLDYNTTAQPDLCDKATGTYLYPNMITRYKIVCY